MYKNGEIYFVIVFGVVLGLLLVGFIITMFFLYQRSRHRQEKEMEMLKQNFEQEILKSQLEIQENTFKTISQELHDNIGQMLSVVKLTLAAVPLETDHPSYNLFEHSKTVLGKAIADLSDITKGLHTDRIHDVGLADSVQFELSGIKKAGLVDVGFSITGAEFPLSKQQTIFVFRIFQEILNNALKHSGATKITVDLIYEGNTFALVMEDNGKGFDVAQKRMSSSSSKGVGLKSLFNRAYLIGATLDFDSKIGKGTRVEIKLASEGNQL